MPELPIKSPEAAWVQSGFGIKGGVDPRQRYIPTSREPAGKLAHLLLQSVGIAFNGKGREEETIGNVSLNKGGRV